MQYEIVPISQAFGESHDICQAAQGLPQTSAMFIPNGRKFTATAQWNTRQTTLSNWIRTGLGKGYSVSRDRTHNGGGFWLCHKDAIQT